jgi:hypothetical protein
VEFFLHYLPHGLIFKPAEILQELETIAHTPTSRRRAHSSSAISRVDSN